MTENETKSQTVGERLAELESENEALREMYADIAGGKTPQLETRLAAGAAKSDAAETLAALDRDPDAKIAYMQKHGTNAYLKLAAQARR